MQTADPRIHGLRSDEYEQELAALRREIEEISGKAAAAASLLGDKFVKDEFEATVQNAFVAFCDLPYNASIDQYREIHFAAKATMDLRDKLKAVIDQRNRLIEEAEDHLTLNQE